MRGTEPETRRSYVSWGDSLQGSPGTIDGVGSPSELKLGSLRGTETDDRPGVFDLTLLALSVVGALISTLMLVWLSTFRILQGTTGPVLRSPGPLAGRQFPLSVDLAQAAWSVAVIAALWSSVVVSGRLLRRPVRRDIPRLALMMFVPLAGVLLFLPSTGGGYGGAGFFSFAEYAAQWTTSRGLLLLGLLPTILAWVLLRQLPSVVVAGWHRAAVCVGSLVAMLVAAWPMLGRWLGLSWAVAAAVTVILLLVGAGLVVAATVECRGQVDRPLWWLMVLLVVVMLGWFAATAHMAVSGFASDLFDLSAAAGFLLMPAYAAAVLVHDYVMVGGATRLPRSSAGGSPAELEDGLRLGLGDPGLQLLFRAPDGLGLLDVGGRAVPEPAAPPSRLQELTVSGASLGVLLWSGDGRPDPARLSVLMGVVAVPLARARMQLGVLSRVIDLTDSRRRMLEAETAARRQIERDLHDGAQQRLTVSLMLLRNASTASDPGEVTRRASEQVEAALREIQSLARGLHSATLASSGLAVAVEELAESLPFPVEVRVEAGRLPQLVEVTAYLVVKECMTNVVKYADATRVSVAADMAGGAVLLRVEDDGCGGADPDGGTGLVGLSDRVGALGGSMRIDSPVGGGTRVDVAIPVTDAAALQPFGS